MRNYIGLASTFHDSAISIVNSQGEVVFAEATERYLQNKRALCSPADDVNRIESLARTYCEPGAEVVYAKTWAPDDEHYYAADLEYRRALDAIALADAAQVSAPIRAFYAKLGFDFDDLDNDGTRYFINMLRWMREIHPGHHRATSANLRFRLNQAAPAFARDVIERRYPHHLIHAATACYSSPFDEAVCAVIDGFGEALTANRFYRYEGGRLTPIEGSKGADGSLGIFYALVCDACGFDFVKGEEWKVMGLAPYGRVDPELYAITRPMMEHVGLGFRPAKDFAARLSRLLARRRPQGSDPRLAADVACTGQKVFCEWSKLLLDDLAALELSKNLVLSGGCALNSSWNGKVIGETAFERLHVYAAPADDGNAIGAALLAYYDDHPPSAAPARALTPYLGEAMSREAVERAIALGGLTDARPPSVPVADFTARLLAAGKIVGWAQGRAEFGPRALGNRSILADPRDPAMKDRINARVKFREEYRPFAPSILPGHGPAYFEHYQDSPYMERTLAFRPEAIARVPAVVHEDGTGRLQTVVRAWNPRYYDLIAAFYALTGVPIVLNTSFNVMSKPIIHSVEDALAVFFTTGLDALVIDDFVFLKGEPPPP